MNEKYATKDGYSAEEEEDELPRDEPKTTEDKLKDLEGKYAELKLNYVDSLKEIKILKAKLKKVDIESRNTPEESNTDNDNLEEVTNIVKSKSYGFKKTSHQSAPESQFECPVCKFILHYPTPALTCSYVNASFLFIISPTGKIVLATVTDMEDLFL